jgi:hypothetical protein
MSILPDCLALPRRYAAHAGSVASFGVKWGRKEGGRGLPNGSIKIGTERINNDVDSTMTPAAFQGMIDKFVKSIEFDSCNTGQDTAFLQTFANSIGTASGYKSTVTFAAPSLFGLFSGYVDVGAGSKKAIDEVPEPSPFVPFLVGLAMIMLARKRRLSSHG